MKRIILALFILITLASMLGAEEIAREKYMPQKLIYSRLSEDYPQEIEELFQFNYNTVQMLAEKGTDYRNREEILKTYISNLPMDEKLYYAYLEWLALNSVPKYYKEYRKINTSTIETKLFPLDSVVKYSIYPQAMYDVQSFRSDSKLMRQVFIPSTLAITMNIQNEIFTEYPEMELILDFSISGIWIKGKVITADHSNRNDLIASRGYYKIQVLDAIGEKFEEKEIIIRCDGAFRDQYIEEGKTYLIRLGYHYGSADPDFKYKSFDGQTLDTRMMYRTSIYECFEITDGQVMKGKDHRACIDSDGGKTLKQLLLQGNDVVPYDNIKQRMETMIHFLKTGSEK